MFFLDKMFSDGGIYLIQYLERFMDDPDLLLPRMIGQQRCDDLLFDADVIAAKRKAIQRLMIEKNDDWILTGKDTKLALQSTEV
jgi:hypothetical protein